MYYLVSDNLPYKVLNGHSSRVTCLLYPHDKSVRFDPSWLLSGGQDSVVICWDIFTGGILHQFNLQSGTVTELLQSPEHYRVSKSIINGISKKSCLASVCVCVYLYTRENKKKTPSGTTLAHTTLYLIYLHLIVFESCFWLQGVDFLSLWHIKLKLLTFYSPFLMSWLST